MTTIKDIVEFLDANPQPCSCGATTDSSHLQYYDHEGGFEIEGMPKQWLYTECSNCGYQLSFKKWRKKSE